MIDFRARPTGGLGGNCGHGRASSCHRDRRRTGQRTCRRNDASILEDQGCSAMEDLTKNRSGNDCGHISWSHPTETMKLYSRRTKNRFTNFVSMLLKYY